MNVPHEFYEEVASYVTLFQQHFPPKSNESISLEGERANEEGRILDIALESVLVPLDKLLSTDCVTLMFQWEVNDLTPFCLDATFFPGKLYSHKEVREIETCTKDGVFSHLQICALAPKWAVDAHLSMNEYDHVEYIYVKFFYLEVVERELFVQHVRDSSIETRRFQFMR